MVTPARQLEAPPAPGWVGELAEQCEAEEAIFQAMRASCMLATRYEGKTRRREWHKVAKDVRYAWAASHGPHPDVEVVEGRVRFTVEPAGAVGPGYHVWYAGRWVQVVRNLGSRDGQLSLHITGSSDQYVNFAGAQSPVLVKVTPRLCPGQEDDDDG